MRIKAAQITRPDLSSRQFGLFGGKLWTSRIRFSYILSVELRLLFNMAGMGCQHTTMRNGEYLENIARYREKHRLEAYTTLIFGASSDVSKELQPGCSYPLPITQYDGVVSILNLMPFLGKEFS